jgi:hypothetical protein
MCHVSPCHHSIIWMWLLPPTIAYACYHPMLTTLPSVQCSAKARLLCVKGVIRHDLETSDKVAICPMLIFRHRSMPVWNEPKATQNHQTQALCLMPIVQCSSNVQRIILANRECPKHIGPDNVIVRCLQWHHPMHFIVAQAPRISHRTLNHFCLMHAQSSSDAPSALPSLPTLQPLCKCVNSTKFHHLCMWVSNFHKHFQRLLALTRS